MTVSSSNILDQFTADGVEASFDITFDYIALDQIKATLGATDITNDIDSIIGSTVSFLTPPSAGTLTIFRETDLQQDIDLLAYGNFPAEVIESGFDKQTMIQQEGVAALGRTLSVPITDPLDSPNIDFGTTLLERQLQLIRFDAAGENLELTSISEIIAPLSATILQSESNASDSADAALISENNALTSANLAEAWASEDEDVVVESGRFSSYHYSLKAAASAAQSSFINPMTTEGDIIVNDDSGNANRIPLGAEGLHMRAGTSGPEYGGDVDMSGDVLRGHTGVPITVSIISELNEVTHSGVELIVTANVDLFIAAQSSRTYKDGHQVVVIATHADGCDITGRPGVNLNGVTAGTAHVNQYEGFGLMRIGVDDWVMPNGAVS